MSGRSTPTFQQGEDLPIHEACVTADKASLKSIVTSVPRRHLELKDSLGRTPLILTVSCNHLDCGAILLKYGVTVDNTDNAGQTALHIAACKGNHEFVRLLLGYNASCIQRDYFGTTPLHVAAINSNVKVLNSILKHVTPAEIDMQDGTLKTALHWAAAYSCNENIKILLTQGANSCIPDIEGKTPLHWAVATLNPEALDCVRTLLKKEKCLINWQDYQGRSPLHIAVNCGSEEILYFIASLEDCNKDLLDHAFCTPLHYAAKKGLSEKADILLKKRASHLSVDDQGATPLHYAAHNNHGETVKVFTSKNYVSLDTPDLLGRNALMWAAIKGAAASVKALCVLENSNVLFADSNGVNALHAAAMYGHADVVKLLVNAGIPVDVKDNYQMSPFLRACQYGRSTAAQTLLNLGANIEEKDVNGGSALHWSARNGSAYLSQILIRYDGEKCIDCNIRDSYGMTPLHCTSELGDFINCTCLLAESGADTNATDIEGKTPLHTAILRNRPGIASYLCEFGIDVNVMFLKDDEWVTPLDCAMLVGNAEIIQVLKLYGAVCAADIKELAAVTIQTWYRKKIKVKMRWHVLKPKKSERELPDYSVPFTSFIPSMLSSWDNKSKCIPVSKMSQYDSHHVCNGCYHKIICSHVCEKDLPISEHHSSESIENQAAFRIQRAWRRYIMKRGFARLRRAINAAFSSKVERLKAEDDWKCRYDDFYHQLIE